MSAWTSDQLDEIGAADELELTTFRSDGTPRKPVTIWAVRSGDSLFIRSWRGRNAAWFRNAQARQAGRIQAGGIDTDVELVNADQSMNDTIDAAYWTKYTPTAPSYVEPMLSAQAVRRPSNSYRAPEVRETCRNAGLATATWQSRRSGSAAWGSLRVMARRPATGRT